MPVTHAERQSLNLRSLIQNLAQEKARAHEELTAFALSRYQESENEAKETESMLVLEKIDGVAIEGIPLKVIYDRIEQFIYNELKSWDLLETNLFSRVRDAVLAWDPGSLKDEEIQAVGTFQTILLNVLNRVQFEQQQQHYRSILRTLQTGLKEGKAILDNKLQHLQQQKKNKEPQIKILKTAIGPKEPDDLNKPDNVTTFTGLSKHIQKKIDSPDPITQADMGMINVHFEGLKNDKIIKPLQQYKQTRGFITIFNEWARDLVKKTFGFGLLSTKATLFGVLKDEDKLFEIGNSRVQSLPNQVNFKH